MTHGRRSVERADAEGTDRRSRAGEIGLGRYASYTGIVACGVLQRQATGT